MGHRWCSAVAAGAGALLLVAGCIGCGGDSATEGTSAVAGAVNGFIGATARVDTGGYFSEPSDVAVYGGGDDEPSNDKIFVVEADAGRSARVQRLDADGNFELAWGADAVRAGAPGDTGTGAETCRRADACQAAPPGTSEGTFRMPTAVAVDDRADVVSVMDSGNRRVQQFTLNGRFVRAWGWGVRTGANRFEICRLRCRPGRRGGPEGNANPGQFETTAGNGIAVGPGGDLFVTDSGNRRVMRFSGNGRFERAWGIGVRTGGDRFESCTAESGCRASRTTARWVGRGWPRHVAVTDDGVVLLSDHMTRGQVVRFDSAAEPDPGTPLPPLRPDGMTRLGLEIDAAGNLVNAEDPFGAAMIEVLADPGDADGPNRLSRAELGGYLQSANGVGVSPTTGVVYVAKSENLNRVDPGTSYTSCRAPSGREGECHGLIVVTARGRPRAIVAPPRALGANRVALAGTVTAPGAISYVFQTSRDGGPWSDVGRSRNVVGAEKRPVRALARRLEPGARYRMRLVLTRLTSDSGDAEERFMSNWVSFTTSS